MLAICFLIHRPTSIIKLRSHCPSSTTVKTSQVYRDKPGNCSYQNWSCSHSHGVIPVLPRSCSRFYHGVVTVHVGVPRFYYGNSSVTHPAAYRSCIYENFDTPGSEAYFVQATYVPRTSYVTATFTWRVSDVSVFVWNFTFVCTVYQGVCATYV